MINTISSKIKREWGNSFMRGFSTTNAQKKGPQPDGSSDYQQFTSAFFKEQELQSRDMEL